jgi:hypothetical protein
LEVIRTPPSSELPFHFFAFSHARLGILQGMDGKVGIFLFFTLCLLGCQFDHSLRALTLSVLLATQWLAI